MEFVLTQLQGFTIELTPWSNWPVALTCRRCGRVWPAMDRGLIALMVEAFDHSTTTCPR
jgi:hypothetical protein